MNRRTLARLSGVGEKTLIDWEHGAHPGIDNLAAVAQVLGLRLCLERDVSVAE
jgi:transcriptional regulator with XRE-family HTH domain